MSKIKVGIIGLGNCASSLIQGLHYYNENDEVIGLMHQNLGGYTIADIEVVFAADVDARKVGKDISEAIFAKPNCTKVFQTDIPYYGVKVVMGKILDGISEHTQNYDEDIRVLVSDVKEPTKEEFVQQIK